MTEPKFCVGDHVIIREEIRETDYYDDVPIVSEMAEKAGCEAVVKRVYENAWEHPYVYELNIAFDCLWPASALYLAEDISENAVASENELAAFLAI